MAITERQREIYDTVEAARSSGVDDPYGYAADKLGITKDGLRGAYSVARRALVTAGEVSNTIPFPAVPDHFSVKGISTYVDEHGETRGQWIKAQANKHSLQDIINALTTTISERITPLKPQHKAKPTADDSLMVLYPVGDMHLGMMASASDSEQDWSLEQAVAVHKRAIDELVASVPATANAVIVNLGDVTHINDPSNQTPRGKNPLDVSNRHIDIITAARDLFIYFVLCLLTKHRSVTVYNEQGNHDPEMALLLAMVLEYAFKEYDNVKVVVDAHPAHYHMWGNVLMGFTHGHQYKPNEMPQIMAQDARKQWGKAEHCYWYMGHFHQRKVTEQGGVITEIFPTLAPKDAWHFAKGYRSKQTASAIVMDKTFGEVGRHTITLSYLMAQIASDELEDVA